MIDNQEYTELIEQGYYNPEIAKMKGINYLAMRRKLLKEGVWQTGMKSRKRYKEYVALRKKSLFMYEIAKEMGIHPKHLYRYRESWNVIGDHPQDYKEE